MSRIGDYRTCASALPFAEIAWQRSNGSGWVAQIVILMLTIRSCAKIGLASRTELSGSAGCNEAAIFEFLFRSDVLGVPDVGRDRGSICNYDEKEGKNESGTPFSYFVNRFGSEGRASAAPALCAGQVRPLGSE